MEHLLFAALVSALVMGLIYLLATRKTKEEKEFEKSKKESDIIRKYLADQDKNKAEQEKREKDRKLELFSDSVEVARENDEGIAWMPNFLIDYSGCKHVVKIKTDSDLHKEIKKIVQSEILSREIEQLNKQIAENQLEMGSYKILKPKKKAGKK